MDFLVVVELLTLVDGAAVAVLVPAERAVPLGDAILTRSTRRSSCG